MPFFLLETQSPVTEVVDGIMGLARSWPFETGNVGVKGFKRGPSFTRALVSSGLTTSEVFSFYLSSEGKGDNFILFGEPTPAEFTTDVTTMRYIQLVDDLFWAA